MILRSVVLCFGLLLWALPSGATDPPDQSSLMPLPAGCEDIFRHSRVVDVKEIFQFNEAQGRPTDLREDHSLANPIFSPTDPLRDSETRGMVMSGDTLLWAARMVYGETGGEDIAHGTQVLWTAFHRYWYSDYFRNLDEHTQHVPAERHITHFLRQFSQPINPSWNLGGSHCPEVSDSNRGPCSAQTIKRRREIQHMRWEDIPLPARQLAFHFMLGLVPQPEPAFRAVDFGNAQATRCDAPLVDGFFIGLGSSKPQKKIPVDARGTPRKRDTHRFCKHRSRPVPDVHWEWPPWLSCQFGTTHPIEQAVQKHVVRESQSILDIVTDTFHRTEIGRFCNEWL